jgi:hypothetical protein
MGIEDFTWSKTEKSIARKAFYKAYEKEISDISKEVGRRINKYKTPKDLWELHNYISDKREETDQKYDYRYSVLILVFARIMKDGYISKSDLHGISESKLQAIEDRVKTLKEI